MLVKTPPDRADVPERFASLGGPLGDVDLSGSPRADARPMLCPPGASDAASPDVASPGDAAGPAGAAGRANGLAPPGDGHRGRAAQHAPTLVSDVFTYPPVAPGIGDEITRALGAFAPALANGTCVALHVTGACGGVGVSTVAREFAATASLLSPRRPLLLDTKRGGAALGPHAALPDLAASYRSRGEIQVVEVQTGAGSFHAAALAASPAPAPCAADTPCRPLADLYEALRRGYDLILLDCPPVADLTGFLPVAPGAPRVLLVVAAGRTRAGEAVRARALVERMGGQLVGAVMTRQRNWLPRFISRMV